MAEIIDRALTALLEDLARKKFAATKRPRASRGTAAGSRDIAAKVRRAVWLRDRGGCAFVSKSGRRCNERACSTGLGAVRSAGLFPGRVRHRRREALSSCQRISPSGVRLLAQLHQHDACDSPTWKSEVEARGFAVIPGVLGKAEVEQLSGIVAVAEPRRIRAGIRHLLGNPAIARLARDPRLIAIASDILSGPPLPFGATLFDKSPGANWLVVWSIRLRSRRQRHRGA